MKKDDKIKNAKAEEKIVELLEEVHAALLGEYRKGLPSRVRDMITKLKTKK